MRGKAYVINAYTCNGQHALKRAVLSESLTVRNHPEERVLEILEKFGRIEALHREQQAIYAAQKNDCLNAEAARSVHRQWNTKG